MIELGIANVQAIKKTPIRFYLQNVIGADFNTVYETSTIPIGYEGNVWAYAVGSATIRRNNTGSWGASVRLTPGDLLNVKMTSGNDFNVTVSGGVRMGIFTMPWEVTTPTEPALNFSDIYGAQVARQYNQTPTNHSSVAVLITVTSGTAQISADNVNWGSSATIAAGAQFWTRYTSSTHHNTVSTSIFTALGIDYSWSIITKAATSGSQTFYTSGNFTVPNYEVMTVQLWGAGGYGAGMTAAFGSAFNKNPHLNGNPTNFYNLTAEGGGSPWVYTDYGQWYLGDIGLATGGDFNVNSVRAPGHVVTPAPRVYSLIPVYYPGPPPYYGNLNYFAQLPFPYGVGLCAGEGQASNYWDGSPYVIGGDTGAYVRKTFQSGDLTEGTVIPVTVGSSQNSNYPGMVMIKWYDGTITPGSQVFTANTLFYVPAFNSLTVKMWGGGASGANSTFNGKDGVSTIFGVEVYQGASTSNNILVAGGGRHGNSNPTPALSYGGQGGNTYGSSVALDVSINGNPGVNGSSVQHNAIIYAPGVGANLYTYGAGSRGKYVAANTTTWGDGGSGAYLEKTFYNNEGELFIGAPIDIFVGAGGGNVDSTTVSGYPGRVEISWT